MKEKYSKSFQQSPKNPKIRHHCNDATFQNHFDIHQQINSNSDLETGKLGNFQRIFFK